MPHKDPAERRAQRRRNYAANRNRILAAHRELRARKRQQFLAYDAEYRTANRTKIRANFMQRTHGLRPEDWSALRDAQDGRCYLCGDELIDERLRIHVDHDHSHCGDLKSCHVCRRGLACGNCNKAIGFAGDDPARLRRMADALETAKLAVERRKEEAGEQLSLI